MADSVTTKADVRVGVLTESISLSSGGLAPAVLNLVRAVEATGRMRADILSLREEYSDVDREQQGGVRLKTYPIAGPHFFGYAPEIWPDLIRNPPDLLHVRGIWRYPSVVGLRWARSGRGPLIVSPAGMLEPWALRFRRWKKWMAWTAYERRQLRNASVIHATSWQEGQNLRDMGLGTPVAVVHSGVNLPPQTSLVPEPESGTKRALFLSRIHPKKGLLNLVEAWNRCRPQGWEMVIAGIDENDHQKDVEEAVNRAGLTDLFRFVGPVYGEQKARLYADSHLFVLPTFSENFGIVVAEALSWEIPVISTQGTPWSELVETGCGWWSPISADGVENALREATSLSPEERRRMGQRGRELVSRKYTWPALGQQMVSVYEWVLGRGVRPDFVLD